MSKCLHNLSLGTCHLYIYVSLKWKIKFERKKNTRWDFIFLSIKQRKQIVNFIATTFDFNSIHINISYSTREKFINLSWVGIQCDLYCIQREVFVVIFECTDFFFNILNNERYHLRVLKSQNIYLEGIHARFKLLLLTNIFTYMPIFFSNAIIMHILYMHAFSPYHFNGNCFNSHISCKLHSPSYKKKYAINILDFLTED